MTDFVIHAPQYSRVSSGIRALWKLGWELEDRGLRVGVAHLGLAFHHEPPPRELPYVPVDEAKDTAVHVYPEIVMGNPASARHYVRWCLGPRRFDEPQEWAVGWLPGFTEGNPADCEEELLRVDVVEADLFWGATPWPRSGILWYAGKAAGQALYPGPSWKQITTEWPENRYRLGQVLRDAELLVTFDPMTCLAVEAVNCGCPVVVASGAAVPTPGVANGWAELPAAQASLDQVPAFMAMERGRQAELLDLFVRRSTLWLDR